MKLKTLRYNCLPLFLFSAVVVLIAANSYAGVGSVGGASVEKGKLSTQLRASYSADDDDAKLDGRWRSRFVIDYGFTDRFALGVYVQGDKPGNNDKQLDSVIMDARFELTESEAAGYDSGIRLRYVTKDDDRKSDSVEFRLLGELPIEKWRFRLNQIFAYEVGSRRRGGIGLETRLQAMYRYVKGHRVGVESFNDFGYGSRSPRFSDQDHTLGAVFMGTLGYGFSYEAGYLHGISQSSPDHMGKLFLKRSF